MPWSVTRTRHGAGPAWESGNEAMFDAMSAEPPPPTTPPVETPTPVPTPLPPPPLNPPMPKLSPKGVGQPEGVVQDSRPSK